MRPVVKPPALRPGDLIMVAALSGALETGDLEDYRRGVEEVDALGFRVEAAPLTDVAKAYWWAAAEPAEVGRELTELFRDPEVKAIWALTGGRFTLSYLDALDFGVIAANPKPFIGMSDIDVLNMAIHSRTGLVTFHAD